MVSGNLIGFNPFEGEFGRLFFNETSANLTATFGIPGFFHPRIPPAIMRAPGAAEALSVYDTDPLRDTLGDLVDFDYLKKSGTRVSVGTVNVRSGNFAYFDNRDMDLAPEHIMASGALPPGFPPVVINGEAYWDGGLVSNTPLQYVLEQDEPDQDLCVFQVDLFSARGDIPKTLFDVAQREKDIRYSSRTRMNTDVYRRLQTMRRAARRLYAKLPKDLKEDEDTKRLMENSSDAAVTIVHLIHRRAAYESQSKDYEFSRLSVNEHWEAGRIDVRRTLSHPDWKQRKKPSHGVCVLDLTRDPAAFFPGNKR